jgi:mono/diheme cytochrome c family protein
MTKKQSWLIPVTVALMLGLAACSAGRGNALPAGPTNTGATGPAVRETSPASTEPPAASGDIANGEQIYFRATGLAGNAITYSGGPPFGGMMMGGGMLTCATCHGPEGHGGNVMMRMQVIDAPPIDYPDLVSMAQSDAGKSSYTIEDFRNAVIQGKDVDGSDLDQDMPRWQMSDQDLTDLFAFLKTLH